MSPHSCGLVCAVSPCCRVGGADALEFYRQQEESLRLSLELEKAAMQSNAIGIAFVTFSSLTEAKRIHSDHRKLVSCLSSTPASSSLDTVLSPASWDVRFAPPPEDIYWENLNRKRHFRVIKVILQLFIPTELSKT